MESKGREAHLISYFQLYLKIESAFKLPPHSWEVYATLKRIVFYFMVI